jgi:hippurate hydrolase
LRVDYELKWTKLTPVLRNDKPTMQRVLNVAREMLGSANVIEMPAPSMGSEDYAWFAEQVPSAHLRIGSKIEGHETAIHRTDYQLNEKVIPLARGSWLAPCSISCTRLSAWPARLRALGRAGDVRQLFAGVQPGLGLRFGFLHCDRTIGGGFGIGAIMTTTPHSSAMITSPELTATPPQETGTQNEPPMPMRLVVMAESPRHHTGDSVLANFADVRNDAIDDHARHSGNLGRIADHAAESRVPRVAAAVDDQDVAGPKLARAHSR